MPLRGITPGGRDGRLPTIAPFGRRGVSGGIVMLEGSGGSGEACPTNGTPFGRGTMGPPVGGTAPGCGTPACGGIPGVAPGTAPGPAPVPPQGFSAEPDSRQEQNPGSGASAQQPFLYPPGSPTARPGATPNRFQLPPAPTLPGPPVRDPDRPQASASPEKSPTPGTESADSTALALHLSGNIPEELRKKLGGLVESHRFSCAVLAHGRSRTYSRRSALAARAPERDPLPSRRAQP